jgi:hypothetical protein
MGTIKEIIKHEEFIKSEMGKQKNKEELAELLEYHQKQIQNFQHERLVHLLVTLFFGLGVLILFVTNLAFPSVGSAILFLVFLVMSVFYVKHYFSLENKVQRLYKISEEIKHLI